MSRPSTCNCECPGCCDCGCCTRSRIRSRRYKNNDICVICQGVGEEKTPPRALCDNCEHVYHSGCLDEWLREENVCPICKRKCKDDPAYIAALPPRPAPADAPGWEGPIYTGSPRQRLRDRLDDSWGGRLMEMLDELDRGNLSQPDSDAEEDAAEEGEYRRRRRFFVDELTALRGRGAGDANAPLEDLEREYRLLRGELGPRDPSIGERRRRFILQEVRRMGQRSARWETWEGEDLEREYRNLREAVRGEEKDGAESDEEGFRYDDESDMSDGEVVMEFESERDYQIMREALEGLDEEKDEREEKGE